MPFVHIVLVKIKADIMAGNGYDQLIAQLNTLKSVPGVSELLRECAWSVPVYEERAKGWNYGLYSTFDSKADFEKYRDHEGHKEFVAKCLRPNVDDVMAYDWEY